MNEKRRLIYPDGKEASYSYNEKGQLTSLSTERRTITYAYNLAGRLRGKAFPNGITTEYAYAVTGHLEKIPHKGNGFEEEYIYQYDMAGNKTEARRQRQGTDTDSGVFGYGYDVDYDLDNLNDIKKYKILKIFEKCYK